MAQSFDNLEPSSLAPLYLLVSQEPLLIDRALGAIRDAAVPEAMRGFNLDQLSGKGLTGDELLAAAQTLPMMAERRLLIVRGFDAMASAELAKLMDYLEAPNPTTVLVGLCQKVDKRIKFFQKAKKTGYLHELGAPKRLGSWIRNEAKERGIDLSGSAADRLNAVVGADLSRLGLALEQLSLYAGDRTIEVDDVDDLIADTRERSVFELTDAIASQSEMRALQAVAGLFDQRQSSIGVVMMLARHMRQLAQAQAGLKERLSRGDLAKRVGVPPFALEKICDQAERYSVRGVANAMRLLGDADRALKGYGQSTKVLGRADGERVLIESLVRELITLGR